MASCMIEKREEFLLSAYGKDKTEAIAKAFQTLQKEAYANLKGQGLIIHMEPVDVELIKEYEQTTKEKVVGFFRPKPTMYYQVELKVIVNLKYIPL